MKVLALLRPAPGVDIQAELRARAEPELRALWALQAEGVVREVYSPGGPGSVMVLEVESLAGAAERLGALPLLADGVMRLELIELRPFTALEMLFATP